MIQYLNSKITVCSTDWLSVLLHGLAKKYHIPKFSQKRIHACSTACTCFKRLPKRNQNSFKPTSNKPEILIFWHLRRVVPRAEVLLFIKRKHQWQRQISGTCSKCLQVCHYSNCYIFWLLVSFPIYFFSCKDSRKHRRVSLWHWKISWRRDSNQVLLRLVVQLMDNSTNEKLPV